MKKVIYTSLAIVCIGIFSAAKAQVHIGISIGTPVPVAPVWVPAGSASPYYYFPDINCYYDMGVGQYVYFENNRWLYSRAVPARFARYDFRRGCAMPVNRSVFMRRGVPAYRDGGRQGFANNNYVMQGRGGRNYGRDHGNGHWHR
ncbi:MAG: hypothetical protein QM610_11655 [Chitinophagaceae bacterium]